MYYTIDQYKKAVKCVYETARTSMEKLVEFGISSVSSNTDAIADVRKTVARAEQKIILDAARKRL